MPLGLSALAAMHVADEARGIDPFQVESTPAPHVTTVERPRIPEPDWDEEERDRRERQRAARIAEATALLEEARPPARPDPPAPKRRSWHRSS